MILMYVIVFFVWLLIRTKKNESTIPLLAVGLITAFIIAVLASFPVVLEIPVSENEVLRVHSPVAYPFGIQQYRDYDAGVFNYILTLGWPDGFPLIQTNIFDDQSEYISIQHYSIGLSLGLILLFFMVSLVGALFIIDKKGILARDQPIAPSVPVLALFQIALLSIITFSLTIGANMFVLGGISILIVTGYVTIREIKSN